MPASFLRKLLRYDEETGKLYWRTAREMAEGGVLVSGHRMGRCGKEAITGATTSGYHKGMIAGEQVYRHEVIWAMMKGNWTEYQLEFIDGDSSNTRIENLRERLRRVKAKSTTLRVGHSPRKIPPSFILEHMEDTEDGDIIWVTDRAEYDGDRCEGVSGDPVFDRVADTGLEFAIICGRKLLKVQAMWVLHNGEYIQGGFHFKDGNPKNVHPENVVTQS